MSLFDINGNLLATGGTSGFNTTTSETEEIIDIYTQMEWTDGKWIKPANGVIADNSSRSISEKIYCSSDTKITFETSKANLKEGVGFNCYDSSDAFLGYVGLAEYSTAGGSYEYSPLEGTEYIIISTQNSYLSGGTNNSPIKALISKTVTYTDFKDTAYSRSQPLVERKQSNEHFSLLDNFLRNYTKWKDKILVTDGNSLVDSTNWGDWTADFLGMTHINLGRSGYAIVYPTDTMDIIKTRVADDYPENADIILLQGDTNRDQNGEVSDQMDDSENPKTTWTAQMNYHIRCIKAKYPNVIIVLMPDSVRYGNDGIQPYLWENNHASYEMMKSLAEYNRIIFWNVDGATPFNPLHDDNWYSRLSAVGDTQDYVHPSNSNGGRYSKAKGYAVAHFMGTLIFDPDAPNNSAADWKNLI